MTIMYIYIYAETAENIMLVSREGAKKQCSRDTTLLSGLLRCCINKEAALAYLFYN